MDTVSFRPNDNHSRRIFPAATLAACLGALVLSADVSCAEPAKDQRTPRRLFAPGSVWNRPLEPDARIDPRSPQLIAGLLREVEREQAMSIGPFIQTDDHSTPLYIVRRKQPVVRVALDDPRRHWRWSLQRVFRSVPIPGRARPAAGSDGHMTVWQPSTDKLWEFWRARKRANGWHASWGGAIKHVSESSGYYTANSWPSRSSYHWGATATSLPVIGGTMLISELESGRIRHALAVDLPAPRAREYSWPAQRTDGTGPPGSIPEGAQLRLPADLNLKALDLPPLTLMMARAVKRRGMIVRDQSGTAIGFFAEDPPASIGDPYYGPDGLFGGKWPSSLLSTFPWGELRVLKMHLCSDQSRPCRRR